MNATITPDALDWDCIFRDYRAKIYVYIERRIGRSGTTNELVEDLTSETFVKAIDAMQRGFGPCDHVSGWLHRIAHNLIVDEYRQRDRRVMLVELESLEHTPQKALTPHEQVAGAIDCECILHAITQLTDKQAEIVSLKAQGGYSGKDLAHETGYPLAATKQLLLRARGKLREVLTTKGVEI